MLQIPSRSQMVPEETFAFRRWQNLFKTAHFLRVHQFLGVW
jgi:hypothetical protein